MMGISLFGTCTMKYNPRLNELIAARPEVAEIHPHQPDDSLQGVLEVIYGLDLILRELSGMDQFVFQAGGGAEASFTHACVTRAYHAARGELEPADRGHHDDPGAPLQRGHGCRGGIQGRDAADRGGRLSVAGRPARGRFRANRRADGRQPGRHGHLQPAHHGMGASSCTKRAGCASTTTPTSTA